MGQPPRGQLKLRLLSLPPSILHLDRLLGYYVYESYLNASDVSALSLALLSVTTRKMPSSLVASKPLLGPVIGLNLWTLAIEVLLYKRRLPAIAKHNVTADPATIRTQLITKLPPFVQWAAENYNHLMEQPTQFYAVVLSMTLLEMKDKTSVRLAWAYVFLRMLHTLVHVSTNNILVRVSLFGTSSLTLLGLTAKAASEMFF